MTVVEELNGYNTQPYSKKLMEDYLRKLNHDDEYIAMMSDILDTLETVMERHNVKEESINWDREGLKLEDNKVILPGEMSKIVDEIVKDNQLYSFFLPEEFGGMGVSGFMIGPLTEKLAYYDLPLQMLIMVGFSILEPLFLYHQPSFDKVINEFAEGKRLGYVAFTEPQAGSNLAKVKSTSEKVGDEYVLNGTKIFISNGGYANTGLFLARNMVDGKEEGTNVFLVDNLDNIDVLRLEEKTGLHANPTAQLHFENVTVPEDYLVATRGDGYRKVLERLLGMRVGVSFQGLAASERAYSLALEYAQNREQFDRPIIQFPDVNRKLDEMKKQIPRMQDYTYRAAYALDKYLKGWVPTDVGANGKKGAEEEAAKMVLGAVRGGIAHYYASSAKIYSTEIANSVLYDAVQIFGGMGFVAETAVNKISRDIRVLPIYEGTSEIHNWLIGRSQQAIDMIPSLKRPYRQYEDSTIYERYLFDRFPGLQDKI